MPTPVRVRKWGNRMAVLIPSHFARSPEHSCGARSLISTRCALVKQGRRRYKLSELVANMNPEHRQDEWDVGQTAGREIW